MNIKKENVLIFKDEIGFFTPLIKKLKKTTLQFKIYLIFDKKDTEILNLELSIKSYVGKCISGSFDIAVDNNVFYRNLIINAKIEGGYQNE